MYKDEVVEEIRKIRQDLAAKWDFDVKAVLADAQKRQSSSGRKVVSFASGKSKPR